MKKNFILHQNNLFEFHRHMLSFCLEVENVKKKYIYKLLERFSCQEMLDIQL